MRIAWVTHRPFDDFGGAERADRMMLERRPEGIEVTIIRPGGVAEDLEEFDRIIVAGMYAFSPLELRILSKLKPIVWAHDMQFSGHWLYDEASIFIALNPLHLGWEKENNRFTRTRLEICPGWMDTQPYYATTKYSRSALWAHRNIEHKGLADAVMWAADKGLELEIMMNQPHQKVIEAMRMSQYFVLLSHIPDPGPFAIMEAQLCGCELVTRNVGFWPDADELRDVLDGADKHFWGIVCESQ